MLSGFWYLHTLAPSHLEMSGNPTYYQPLNAMPFLAISLYPDHNVVKNPIILMECAICFLLEP